LTVLSLNVLGDGLRDALDPRTKLRSEEATDVFRDPAAPRPDAVRDVRHFRVSFS
jgi:hypothetical protein